MLENFNKDAQMNGKESSNFWLDIVTSFECQFSSKHFEKWWKKPKKKVEPQSSLTQWNRSGHLRLWWLFQLIPKNILTTHQNESDLGLGR